jgi:hypothetical protein
MAPPFNRTRDQFSRRGQMESPIQEAWLRFTDSVAVLLVPKIEDRPLDQYLAFRDRVVPMVQAPSFLQALLQAWKPMEGKGMVDVGAALLEELEAFPRMVEVAARATEDPEQQKGWLRDCLSKASIVAGSVHDLLEGLPPYARGAIKLFREVVDLFKSNG